MALPPVIPCCHVHECWAHGETDATLKHDFIHGCEGHPERFGAYVAPSS